MYNNRLNKTEWEVRPVDLDIAQHLVEQHHYAHGGSNTAVYVHGLFKTGDIFDWQCQGVCWWIPPTKSAALATYPTNWKGVLCLSRMVILPDVPKNAATFLLARSRRLIDRNTWPCLITYADEWQGHQGTIYKADNWKCVGPTKPGPVYVKNGRMISRKAGPKTRNHAEMIALGCEMVGKFSKLKYVQIATRRSGGLSQRPPIARTADSRTGGRGRTRD